MLNPIWLDTFVTLADTGNFTRTAELRFMTQPGVSQHIKKLEQACDCALLIRLGKGIQLTEQGQRVYRYATEYKAQQSHFLESLKFDERFEGTCTIGCSGAIAQRIYPLLLTLQQKHEKLNIHLEVAPQQRILSGLENNTIELGIVARKPDEERFHSDYLGEEALSLFLPRHMKETENIADTVRQLGLINHPDAKHYVQLYFNQSGEDALTSLNLSKIKQAGYVNQLSQILLPISKGVGFTVLPSSTLNFVNYPTDLVTYNANNIVSESLYRVKTAHRALPARYDSVIKLIDAELQVTA